MSLRSHFLGQVASLGLHYDPTGNLASRFQDLCAERDIAHASIRRDGYFRSNRMRIDGATPKSYRLDGAERMETQDQAIARAVKDAQLQTEARGYCQRKRLDGMVPMASQGLTDIVNQVYQIRHRGLTAWDGGYLPIATDVDRAAEEFVWYESDLQGVAKAASTYTPDDIPLVAGPTGHANKGTIVPALVGYQTNFMDDRRAALARANNKPDFRIEQRKIQSCNRVIAEFYNALWQWGDTEEGIVGLHNHSGIQAVNLPVGDWGNSTGLGIKDDVNFMMTFIQNQSKGDLGDTSKLRLYIPRFWYDIMAAAPVTAAGTGTAASVLKFMRDTLSLRDDQIQPRDEIMATNSHAFEGGPQNLDRDRAVLVYFDEGSTDPELDGDPSFILSQPIELPTAPIQTGVGQVQYFHARGGGLRLPDARRVVFFEGFEAP